MNNQISYRQFEKIDKTLPKESFFVGNTYSFLEFFEKILLTVFFVIGFKTGNSPGMGENVKDVKLGFWAMEKE